MIEELQLCKGLEQQQTKQHQAWRHNEQQWAWRRVPSTWADATHRWIEVNKQDLLLNNLHISFIS